MATMWTLFLFFLFGLCQHVCAELSTTVTTSYGQVQGSKTSFGRVFYGIPFAKAPTGTLRWKPPQNITSWSPSIRSATVRPPACMQAACNSGDSQCVASMSEDCLYLNIFTPLQNTTSPFPVMIFIHGGCFFQGGASIVGFDSDRFVNTTNVIMVFVQYRLGMLGFLANGSGSSDLNGNYGILDQQMAIKWVYNNINAFGGDPNKITLVGESAGAQSVAVQYVSDSMQSYFKGAIIQSAPLTIAFKSYNDYYTIFNNFCGVVNCWKITLWPPSSSCDLQCLRNLPASTIISFQANNTLNLLLNAVTKPLQIAEPWNPVVDGTIIKDKLFNTITKDNVPRKPLIIGTNGKEMLGLIYMVANSSINSATYYAALRVLFGTYGPSVNTRFPAQDYTNVNADQRQVLSQVLTQWMFSCPARSVIRNATYATTFAYVFNYGVRTYGMLNFPICEGQPCHGYELALEFQSMWNNFTANDKLVSQAIATYWTNFAKTQNPNFPEPVPLSWPVVTLDQENYMTFDTTLTTTTNYLKADCEFWDGVGYNGNWF